MEWIKLKIDNKCGYHQNQGETEYGSNEISIERKYGRYKSKEDWIWTWQIQRRLNVDVTNPKKTEYGRDKPKEDWMWTWKTQRRLNIDVTNPQKTKYGCEKPTENWIWIWQTHLELIKFKIDDDDYGCNKIYRKSSCDYT